MYFDSWQALWHMGGHGAYVWSAYCIAAITLTTMVAAPMARRRRFLTEQARIEGRRQARRAN